MYITSVGGKRLPSTITRRVANRPGMAGIVPELTHGVPCPGRGSFCPGNVKINHWAWIYDCSLMNVFYFVSCLSVTHDFRFLVRNRKSKWSCIVNIIIIGYINLYSEPGIEATACARELLYVYVYVYVDLTWLECDMSLTNEIAIIRLAANTTNNDEMQQV